MEWKKYPLNESKFDDFESFDSNPFFELIEKGGYIAKQQGTKFSASNQDIVDKNTGKISTVYIRQEKKKYIDKREFVKLPETGFLTIANLVPSELRLLIYIFSHIKQSQFEIKLKIQSVMEFSGYSSRNPVYKAITGLLNKGFIAKKTDSNSNYFINPLLFYKGNIVEEFFNYVFARNKAEHEERLEQKRLSNNEKDEYLG